MDTKLKGKRALVCAASKGLGRAIAESLAAEGARLMICARSEELLTIVQAECLKAGAQSVDICIADLTEKEDRLKLIETVKAKSGGLDVLVHNTGGPKPTAVLDTTCSDWQDGFDNIFIPIVELNEAFLPEMRRHKWGRILAVTSSSVLEPIAGLAISNAIRSAVTSMLKTLSDEIATDNITVNCLAPGLIETQRLENLMQARIAKSGQSKDEYMQDYLKPVPAQRLGTPEEFAAMSTFLCSEQASYLTGSTFCIDGGKRRSTY